MPDKIPDSMFGRFYRPQMRDEFDPPLTGQEYVDNGAGLITSMELYDRIEDERPLLKLKLQPFVFRIWNSFREYRTRFGFWDALKAAWQVNRKWMVF